MKSSKLWVAFLSLILLIGFTDKINAQTDTDTTTYLVIKNDGSRYIGQILSQDSREVVLLTKELGEIAIPKHEIKEIRELSTDEVNEDGSLKTSSPFSTRYYITTNAQAVSKGDNYIIWNLYGPDIQFGVSDNFGVGLMTTWFGSPIVGSAKYSLVNDKKIGVAVGTLLGTGSWASPEYGIAVPFGSFTYGSIEKNVSLSLGYGAVFGPGSSGGSPLFSLAGINRVSERVSLVFDSFVVTEDSEVAALIIPAIRLHSSPEKAFQIGFAAVAADGELLPMPFPFLQWFRKL
ncbi:MAG: hypothetical protein CL670_09450 [Balneola sp.]|nr:hypothetical protein [Balneola sp.]MBE79366.1 hypothetical protein [Balneola sp.]|tara:strand:+ start:461 stop:1330 length:870 start_codon:yes stop_codon:yes gene_type:complete